MTVHRAWARVGFGVIVISALSAFSGKADRQGAGGGPQVWLGRPDGSRSCEPESGLQWKQVLAQMKEAGVLVLQVAEGSDGKRRVQLCGTPTGRWLGVLVSSSDAIQAEATGWRQWPEGFRRENERTPQ